MAAHQPSQWWTVRAKGLSACDLQQVTRRYWRGELPAPDATLDQRVQWYIQTLLPEELDHADRVRGAIKSHPCHTLVLLVGHSPEPLLQAIGVFQPQRVLLLLNQQYGIERGCCVGSRMARWIDDWLGPLLPAAPAVDCQETIDRPDAVFQSLCDSVLSDRRAGRSVIVDITGAKKSIVAGAFLFAAYADLSISYVDFDDYDAEMRRPLGYQCRIDTLANPYDAFRLREWEQIRRFYDNYQFRAAAGRLSDLLKYVDQIRQAPGAPAVLQPFHAEDRPSVQALLDITTAYSAWEDGDYHRARELFIGTLENFPSFEPPAAVRFLGGVWPTARRARDVESAARSLLETHAQVQVMTSNALLIPYARDELSKIERLVGADEDNRSALLRAAGLDELLLKARLVRLWRGGQVDVWAWRMPERREELLGACNSLDPGLEAELYEKLLAHDGSRHIRRTLQGIQLISWAFPAFVRLDAWQEYRIRPARGAPRLADYEQGAALSADTLTEMRNEAIHMVLYVTQAIALAAVELCRANLDEFERQWAPLSGPSPEIDPRDVQRLPWAEVCAMCGLDFLPLASDRQGGGSRAV